MIKSFLGLSLILNFVLGYFLIMRKPDKEVVERLVIETHAGGKQESQPGTKRPAAPVVKSEKSDKKKTELPELSVHDVHDFQEAGEKMESDRHDFFSEVLGMPEEKITQHNKLREEFFKKTASFWSKNPMRELNFKERRQMLALEEEFHKNLERLHGKKNWEKYQKFREDYNARGYKKQMEDGQPFLFMGL